jgi:transposase
MLALATTQEGAIPVFLRPLDGNASDQRELAQTIEALVTHLREAGDDAGVYVAASGVDRAANMRHFAQTGVRWISRVPEPSREARAITRGQRHHARPETSREAKARAREEPAHWQTSADRKTWWFTRRMDLPQGVERWIVVATQPGEARAHASVTRRAQQDREPWERQLWHLGNQEFACQADAEIELQRRLKTLPAWLRVESRVSIRAHDASQGRPAKGTQPVRESWQAQATATLDEQQRRARFIVATNVLDPSDLADEEAIGLYTAQSGVERGFSFLKDPLFLASSVFLKKPERLMALSLILVVCLLVYRLAEWRLRQALAHTGQTVPTQLHQPTDHPTMRGMFECFEGLHLVTIRGPGSTEALVHGLLPLHALVVELLGPEVQKMYK